MQIRLEKVCIDDKNATGVKRIAFVMASPVASALSGIIGISSWGDKPGQTTCCFCGKDLNKEFSAAEIRGGIGNKVLAKLCDECYREYRMLQQNRSLLY